MLGVSNSPVHGARAIFIPSAGGYRQIRKNKHNHHSFGEPIDDFILHTENQALPPNLLTGLVPEMSYCNKLRIVIVVAKPMPATSQN